MKSDNWYFPATLVRVIDGDTVKLVVDAGFRITFTDSFRLARIDAPELRTPCGVAAKSFLSALLDNQAQLKIETIKHGKYRWIVDIWLADGRNVSDELVKCGHAKYKQF